MAILQIFRFNISPLKEAQNGRRFLLAIVFLFFSLAIVLLSLRQPFGMEARAGVFVRGILESSHLVSPVLYNRPYTDYPPLFFLMEAVFCRIFGRIDALSLALPTLLSAIGLIGAVYLAGKRFLDEDVALASAIVLAATPEFWLKAQKATLDMTLSFFTFAALICVYSWYVSTSCLWDENGFGKVCMGYRKASNKYLWLASFFMGLAYMTKGPIGVVLIVFPSLVFMVLEKRYRQALILLFHLSFAAILVIAIYFGVLVCVYGTDVISLMLDSQVFSRIASKANRPFYYYLLFLAVSFSPWLLWIFFCGYKRGIMKKRPLPEFVRFSCCCLLAGLLPFLMASSRHSRYLLPIFPFIALLIGYWISRSIALTQGLMCRKSKFFVAIAFLLLLITGISAIFVEPALSRKESGRAFVLQAESRMTGNDTAICLLGIRKDGDGLKYALYSRFYPDSLFFPRVMDIDGCPRKKKLLVVTYEKYLNDLLKKRPFRQVANGYIHGKKVVAIELASKK